VLFLQTYSCSIFNEIYAERGSRELVIGGGFVGIIRKVKVFQYPKVKKEALHNMRLASKINQISISVK
jgi:hypothetical protein